MFEWQKYFGLLILVMVANIVGWVRIKKFSKNSKLRMMIAKDCVGVMNFVTFAYIFHTILQVINRSYIVDHKMIFALSRVEAEALLTFTFETVLVIVFFYTLIQFVNTLKLYLEREHQELARRFKLPIDFVRKILKVAAFVIILSMVSVFHEYHRFANFLLSTGAIGSAFFALSLRQAVGNFLGGLKIMFSNLFQTGEYITIVKSGISGLVKEISWEGVTLKESSGVSLYVNNDIFLKDAVINTSRRMSWRISKDFGLRHVDRKSVNKVMKAIEKKLSKEQGVQKNGVFVSLKSTGEYAIYINVSAYLENINFSEKRAFQNKMIHSIMEIFEKYGVRIALHSSEVRSLEIDDTMDSEEN